MAESNDSDVVGVGAVAAAVLAMLKDHGGKSRRDRLASRLHTPIRVLDPVVDELEQQGKVSVILGRKGGTISLRPN